MPDQDIPSGDPWDGFLTGRDRAVFGAAGYGTTAGDVDIRGQRLALLVVDVNRDFAGDQPEPILDSIRRYPNSCGQEAWDAIARLAPLLTAARGAGVPVLYTTNDPEHTALEDAAWGRKNSRIAARRKDHRGTLAEIPAPIAPTPSDVVVSKTKPSAFFGTPLPQYLTLWQTTMVVCCGATTSGCVRATVVDAFSHGYAVRVVSDCTFDRGQASHALSLFDMAQKCTDLCTADQLRAQLGRFGQAPLRRAPQAWPSHGVEDG